MALRLRAPAERDEAVVLDCHQQLALEGFAFALFYEQGMAWRAYLELLERYRHGEILPERLVPSTFLLAEAEGTVVGRSSIRHALNERLIVEGGHIGFCVCPAHRRRGYATEILRQSLMVVWRLGLERALITCEESNTGSATVIERCGGALEDVRRNPHGRPIRRYWIGQGDAQRVSPADR